MPRLVMRRIASATVIATSLIAGSALSAEAHGATTWNGSWSCILGAYTGSSWVNGAGGTWSITTQSGSCPSVGAAVRFYSGASPYTYGNGYAERYDARVAYGGYHKGGNQTKTT